MFKILIAEDNELNCDMLTRRLARRGYHVMVAVNGKEAVEIAHALVPDLILMDMCMPVLDGWQATRLLKSAQRTRSISVIALTAHTLPQERERAIAVGCDDYDSKPVDMDRLLGKIQAIVDRTGAPAVLSA